MAVKFLLVIFLVVICLGYVLPSEIGLIGKVNNNGLAAIKGQTISCYEEMEEVDKTGSVQGGNQ